MQILTKCSIFAVDILSKLNILVREVQCFTAKMNEISCLGEQQRNVKCFKPFSWICTTTHTENNTQHSASDS